MLKKKFPFLRITPLATLMVIDIRKQKERWDPALNEVRETLKEVSSYLLTS